MRIGMVGLDNSHCTIFAGMLNDPDQTCHTSGAELVGAYKGGSDQFSLSRDRIDRFTEELTERYGIPLYESIEDLAANVDAILLESTNGRQHAEQFRRAAAGKPIYIDKLFATSTADARAIIEASAERDTPVMSCSSLRYGAGIWELHSEEARVLSCEAFGPAPILDDYPGLFWYGVHGTEILFSLMGSGCARVCCFPYCDGDIAIGGWADGRTGVLRGLHTEDSDFGCVVHVEARVKFRYGAGDPVVVLSPPQADSQVLRNRDFAHRYCRDL